MDTHRQAPEIDHRLSHFDHPSTIVALATARGQAALAIVRVSGPEAVSLVASRFSNGKALQDAPSHTVHVGFFLDSAGARLDQVVVTLFRAPRSATGEDVAEVTCHGGDLASQLILQSLSEAGARLAAPGEFTQRAFLNGKLDLTQAEAVADLIHAHSGLAHQAALHALEGRIGDAVAGVRERLLEMAVLVELELDFSDEDVAFADRSALRHLLAETDRLLGELLGAQRLGRLVRDGVRVVIGGRPNVGKSTLLNALVGRDRAIVSPTPGTTRDAIEAEMSLHGLLIRFVDTAGLRDTADAIEAEGVRRSHHALTTADAVVYVYGAPEGLDDEETALIERLTQEHPSLPVFCVANKIDLPHSAIPTSHLALSAREAVADSSRLDPLCQKIYASATDGMAHAESSLILVNERHRRHLQAAREAVGRAQQGLTASLDSDLLALDLRVALDELGAVTGAVTRDDVLGAIFSRFCIGK